MTASAWSDVSTLAVAALLVAAAGVSGQEACPRAAGEEAESGWAAYREGSMARADRHFRQALERCPGDPYASTGLGYVALRGGELDEARGRFEDVVARVPGDVDALVGLGLVSWRTGALAEARRAFEGVLREDPAHPTALEYVARLDPSAARGAEDPADIAWRSGDVDGAVARYEERLRDEPRDGVALLRLGLAAAWAGETERGLELLDRLVRLEPSNGEARLARARVLMWAGRLGEARRQVEALLAVAPDDAEALETLGRIQVWSGHQSEAAESFARLLSVAPDHDDARRAEAEALVRVARYDQAVASWERILAGRPDDVDAALGLARALAFSRDWTGALAVYDGILERAPDDGRARMGKARTLAWAGHLVEAEGEALAAVESDPASGAAWAVLGAIYRMQERPADAAEALRGAAQRAPSDPDVRDQLASALRTLRPAGRVTAAGERDSDGNRMLTQRLMGLWRPATRLELRADIYLRSLEQERTLASLRRQAFGGTLTGSLELRPGWRMSLGAGGSATDGTGRPGFLSLLGSVATPRRHPLAVTLSAFTRGIDETAAMAERGIRARGAVVTARWLPALRWRVDGSLGLSRYEGSEANRRRSASLALSRRLGAFSLGASYRVFGFDEDLDDGYFDPDAYQIAEITSWWLHRPLPWSFLVELAPGVQRVEADGDLRASLRGSARVGWAFAAGRELSLSYGHSSANLNPAADGTSGYRYGAVIVELGWVF